MKYYLVALLCVLGLTAGQILFKLSACYLLKSGSFFDLKTAAIIAIAFSIYGLTTLAWIWVLQQIDLGRAYPLMALAFVFVPIGSYYVFGERFQMQYFLGILLICAGIVISIKS